MLSSHLLADWIYTPGESGTEEEIPKNSPGEVVNLLRIMHKSSVYFEFRD